MINIKVLELFAGTRSVSKAFEKRGHETFSVEWDKQFENIDIYDDVNNVTAEDILERFGHPDVVWISSDCTSYSVAALGKHRRKNKETGELDPITDYARFCDSTNKYVISEFIKKLNPKFFFWENPRGGLRTMSFMQEFPRYTVTYCQYTTDLPLSQRRMKPTDIWTNHPNPKFKPPCKNGDKCHAPAPRGARTGTQGIKGSVERSKIPTQLCEHIVDICEEALMENVLFLDDVYDEAIVDVEKDNIVYDKFLMEQSLINNKGMTFQESKNETDNIPKRIGYRFVDDED